MNSHAASARLYCYHILIIITSVLTCDRSTTPVHTLYDLIMAEVLQYYSRPEPWIEYIHTLYKHPGQTWPGKGPLGPNSIPGQRWPGNQSTWRGIWPRAGPFWPHYMSSLRKADRSPGHPWPGMEFGPKWTLSGSSLTRRVFLECIHMMDARVVGSNCITPQLRRNCLDRETEGMGVLQLQLVNLAHCISFCLIRELYMYDI